MASSLRAELLHRQGGLCFYCGREMTLVSGFSNSITRDHVVPRSRGGLGIASNIVGACSRCNNLKSDMLVTEFLATYPTPEAIEAARAMKVPGRATPVNRRLATGHRRLKPTDDVLRARAERRGQTKPNMVRSATPAYDREMALKASGVILGERGPWRRPAPIDPPAHYIAALEKMTFQRSADR